MEQEIVQQLRADEYETALLRMIRIMLDMRARRGGAWRDPFSKGGDTVRTSVFTAAPGEFAHHRLKWIANWDGELRERTEVFVNYSIGIPTILEILNEAIESVDRGTVFVQPGDDQ